MIKLNLIKYDNVNCLEASWFSEEIQIQIVESEKELDGKIVKVKEQQEVVFTTQIKCHAYSDTQIDMLRADAKELGTSLDEYEDLIKEIEANIVLPTKEQLELIALKNEKQRILSIKSKAGEIINSKYSIFWQLNHPRSDEAYKLDYEWIDNIRAISNKAELDSTALDDIDWGI